MKNERAFAVIFIKALSLVSDVFAFIAALFLAPVILSYLGKVDHLVWGDVLKAHTITFVLAACFIAILFVTGQYSKRKPLWGQILYVVKISFVMLAIDIITRSAANYGQPSLYPLVYWPLALCFFVIFRFVLNFVKTKSKACGSLFFCYISFCS